MNKPAEPKPPPLTPETRAAFRLLLELAERAARRRARRLQAAWDDSGRDG